MKDWFNNDSCKYILTLGIKLSLIPHLNVNTREGKRTENIHIFFGGGGGGRALTSYFKNSMQPNNVVFKVCI